MNTTKRARTKAILKKKLESISKNYNVNRRQVDIHFTHRCLFKCKHCFHWTQKNYFDDLKLEEWYNLLDDILSLYGREVEISIGGDGMGLLNPKTLPIISKSSDHGFYTVLNSNGFLINNVILNKLVDSGLNVLSLSLDFTSADKHDEHRGVKNSFKHVMNLVNYANIFDYNLKIIFNCVIMGPNLNSILDLVKFVNQLGPKYNISFQVITHPMSVNFIKHWYKNERFKHLWPQDISEVFQVIDELIVLKKNGYKIENPTSQLMSFKNYFINPEKCVSGLKCNVQDIGLHIFNGGITKMCPYMEKVGVLRDNSILSLMKSEQANKVYTQMYNCSENCHQLINCRFQDDSVFRLV